MNTGDIISDNWAGYAKLARIRSCEASWTVPKTGVADAVIWLGIGGLASSDAVVQAGCNGNGGGFWWETYDTRNEDPPHGFARNPLILPGDDVTVAIHLLPLRWCRFHVRNWRSGRTATEWHRAKIVNPVSAEVIYEPTGSHAPSTSPVHVTGFTINGGRRVDDAHRVVLQHGRQTLIQPGPLAFGGFTL